MVRIDINVGNMGNRGKARTEAQQALHLNAPTIVRFLITEDEGLNDLIILGTTGKRLMTTDKELHEAIGSITKYDQFKLQKLAKLFEMVDIFPYKDMTHQPKPILTHEKVEEIRKEALKQPNA